MKNYNIYIFIYLFISNIYLHAQQISKPTFGTFALINAELHTVTNGIQNGTILIEDGKITDIGPEVDIPASVTLIDCAGKRIYPGLIDAGTHLGLSEVGSISLTQDFVEIGNITPQMEALTAVNPNSVAIPVTRTNGVTTVLTTPDGGLMPGTAALINLHGYTPQQMYAGFSGVVFNYPTSAQRGRYDRRSEDEIKKEANKKLDLVNELWDKIEVYARIVENGETPDYNPALAAILPVYKKEKKLLIEVNEYSDILAAIRWIKEKDVEAVLMGVSEGWRVADSIAASGIPVITGPVLALPGRASDKYDQAYTNPGILMEAGVKVALRTNDIENVRNLPFNAGFAAAYGMGIEEALKAVTIQPAEIFGLGDIMGSLEVGKIANLFVVDGDPFEPKSKISHLFISGWDVPIENRQTYLYDEFLEREPGLKE